MDILSCLEIFERGRWPAIDILKSHSRIRILKDQEQFENVRKARQMMALYEEMKDMIYLGSYQKGQSEEIDRAISSHKRLETFLQQDLSEGFSLDESFAGLKDALTIKTKSSETLPASVDS